MNLIKAIEEATANPLERPDPLALAVLSNNLNLTIQRATSIEYPDVTIADLDKAIRHYKTHIATQRVDAVVKKWGKR